MKYVPKKKPEGINSTHESPLKDAVTLALATAFVVVVSFVVLGVFTKQVVKKIDLKTESHLFQNYSKKKIAIETDQSKKVQKLVDRLWENYPESKDTKIKVTIESSGPMNAFMKVGGQMILTTKLLESVKYENELAFVVCHEIGHFYHRDVLHGMGRQLGLAFILSYLGFGESMDVVTLSAESLALSFDRKQEQKADEFAIECMNKNYGHVQGHDQFFKLVLKQEAIIPEAGRKALSFASSHPLTEKRIDNLKSLIEKLKLSKHGKLTRLPY